jgi:hypothetical protein
MDFGHIAAELQMPNDESMMKPEAPSRSSSAGKAILHSSVCLLPSPP